MKTEKASNNSIVTFYLYASHLPSGLPQNSGRSLPKNRRAIVPTRSSQCRTIFPCIKTSFLLSSVLLGPWTSVCEKFSRAIRFRAGRFLTPAEKRITLPRAPIRQFERTLMYNNGSVTLGSCSAVLPAQMAHPLSPNCTKNPCNFTNFTYFIILRRPKFHFHRAPNPRSPLPCCPCIPNFKFPSRLPLPGPLQPTPPISPNRTKNPCNFTSFTNFTMLLPPKISLP